MRRFAPAVFALVVSAISASAASNDGIIRVGVKHPVDAGARQAVVSVYATPEGGEPIASEWRVLEVDRFGRFATPLGSLSSAVGAGADERWIGVRIVPGAEGRRVRLNAGASSRITLHVVTDAAITANGIVESISQGFRFPDGTVQTSAATVSGGVPSVNGIGGAVTIVGAGSVSVGTAGSTITVTGPVTYVRTIIVSPVVGNPLASGTALRNALGNISGNSATNQYLLKIEPGVYDLGGLELSMKSYVDIEGSGQNTTLIITARGDSTFSPAAAAVVGAASSEIRNLTLTNNGAGTAMSFGYYAGAGTMRITDVTINSTGGTSASVAVFALASVLSLWRVTATAAVVATSNAYGVSCSAGSTINIVDSTLTGRDGGGNNAGFSSTSSTCVATIDGSTLIGTGSSGVNYGVFVNTGNVTVTHSTARADGSSTRYAVSTTNNINSVLNVSHSSVLAFSPGLSASHLSVIKGPGSTLRVATSLVDSATLGTPTCVHVYNSDFTDLNNVCPSPDV